MKKIILYIIVLTAFNCKAQNIVPIYNSPFDTPDTPYYKDVDGDFNSLIGVWKWQDGNNSWTIEFKKINKYHSQIPTYDDSSIVHSYYDFLVGEYKYVENGLELMNTLPVDITKEPYDNNIYASRITTIPRGLPSCIECPPNTRFIIGYIKDSNRLGLKGKIRMAHFTENGVEKIRLRLTQSDSDPSIVGDITYTGPTELTLPNGTFTFVKQ